MPSSESTLIRKPFFVAAPFFLPLIFCLVFCILVPVLGTVLSSLYQEVSFLPKRFVGLENFAHLAQDTSFWQALRFTLLFALISVPLEIGIGLL